MFTYVLHVYEPTQLGSVSVYLTSFCVAFCHYQAMDDVTELDRLEETVALLMQENRRLENNIRDAENTLRTSARYALSK